MKYRMVPATADGCSMADHAERRRESGREHAHHNLAKQKYPVFQATLVRGLLLACCLWRSVILVSDAITAIVTLALGQWVFYYGHALASL